MATARHGEALSTGAICGYALDLTGPICGQPADYEIDFGWKNGDLAAACAEHAALARREFTVRQIRSATTAQDTGRPFAAKYPTLGA
jgi:hypothetical protein